MKLLVTYMTLVLSLQQANAAVGEAGNHVMQHVTADTPGYQTQAFARVKECPVILDSAAFIAALKSNCHLTTDQENNPHKKERVTAFRKIQLAGSSAGYYLLEYTWQTDDSSAAPNKYQLVFTGNGTLLKAFSAIQYDLVKIFGKEAPFLMVITASPEGNGQHAFYKVAGNTLVNVYKGFESFCPSTYDSKQDETVNEPFAFNTSFTDVNKDGFNDIVFKGKLVLIQAVTKNGLWYDVKITKGQPQVTYSIDNPFRKLDVEYVFLYNSKTKQFEAMKDYSKYCTNNLALLLYRTLD